ncbi:hypothetical protein, conserved [Leishmania donovani]|uniref:Uncharacterized protein n=1 Tax=Leishmania donovani TaxID=5661 RepID=A0A3Q8IWC9_LEIDO|nr:hypothetical protein, conserved [Leishmania donovani]AYU83867.1 hypothetical protein LdCL_360058300 [Leishmania donovani]TPP48617.1 hypothetical protein CGC21_14835 [Leishmania donovani]CBZ38948.1 hypothetical protein, conserved [Leishmania donovani]
METCDGVDGVAGAPKMTESLILQQCRTHQGYSTPELNEKLYLHHLGFTQLDGLAAFTGCVVLYLDHNALSDLAGLAALTRLDSLYLSCNALSHLDSMPRLPLLRTLDVAQNQIVTLNGLDEAAPQLQTLLAGRNKLQSLDGVQGLSGLLSLDVSHNCIEDEEATSACLCGNRATLRTLLLHGNELCRRTPHHRKRWIAAFPALRFLDEYPVFDDERARAEAFAGGGAAAEAEIRSAQRTRALAEAREQFAYYGDIREAQRAARLRNGAETQATPYFLAHTPSINKTVLQDAEDEPIYIPATRGAAVHQDPLRG